MTLALIAFGAIAIIELSLWLPLFWKWRKVLSYPLIAGVSVTTVALLVEHFSSWTILLVFLSGYRTINLLRLIKGRTQADYLFRVARNCSLWLISWQAVILLLALANHYYQLSPYTWWYLLAGGQLLIAGVALASTTRHLRTTVAPAVSQSYADKDLPTLTVAIPARNETDDLEACLRSLVANGYPKLEILVLDDCSQERRTPEIIRGFAHDGVRFIAGEVPPEHWLAKNYAYDRLVKEANGELLFFCGVDARFEANSLRVIVETLLEKKKEMMSFIPRNDLPEGRGLEVLLVQPARYAWELSLPRRWLNRPPVLSTCWLITKAALHAAGGFKAVAHSSSPESYFAKKTAKNNDGYSFIQSSPAIGLSCAKTLEEQRLTAIRTRYPQLHRRPELVGLTSLVELLALFVPIIVLIGLLAVHAWLLVAICSINVVLLTTFYSRITTLTYRQFLLRGLWLLPFAALYDIGLLNYSLWQYEFGEVIWKGRNVCVPVMRAIPSLPKLP